MQRRPTQKSYEVLRISDDYFNPMDPLPLRYFATAGGIGLCLCIVMSNGEWSLGDGALLSPEINHSIMFFHLAIKLLLEMMICDPTVGVYYHVAQPLLIGRLLQLSEARLFRETALILTEHMLSVLGPVINFQELGALKAIGERMYRRGCGARAELASLCRVIAISLVPNVMAEPSLHLEPPTMAIARAEHMERVILGQRIDDHILSLLVGLLHSSSP